MKTPDEIKKGLERCYTLGMSCTGCAYEKYEQCNDMLALNALSYIKQLESCLAQAEQDAKEMANNLDCSACTWCEYGDFDYKNEACKECRTYNEGFKLRSFCPESTKEDNKE